MMKSLLVLSLLMAVRANASRTAHYSCDFQVPKLGAGTDSVPDRGDQSDDTDRVCDIANGYYNQATNANNLPSPHVNAFNAEFGSSLKYCAQNRVRLSSSKPTLTNICKATAHDTTFIRALAPKTQ